MCPMILRASSGGMERTAPPLPAARDAAAATSESSGASPSTP